MDANTENVARQQGQPRQYGTIAVCSSHSTIWDTDLERFNPSSRMNEIETNTSRKWTSLLPGWIQSYRRDFVIADLVGALTVATLYIPLSLSFATIGHVPAASSLYAFIIHPLIYAITGSCSLLVIGPEATGSLLVGAVIHNQESARVSDLDHAMISGAVTSLAGVILVGAKFAGLSFFDKVLSRPLMKGFISGVGLVLIVDQAVPALGLEQRMVAHSDNGSLCKLFGLLQHIFEADFASTVISCCSLSIILMFGSLKMRLQKRSLNLFPDRLLVIATTAILVWFFELPEQGLKIVGSIGSSGSILPPFSWPFMDLSLMQEIIGPAVTIALLAYFESSLTAKTLEQTPSLGRTYSRELDPDRELFALGFANIVGGLFTTLPACGGFGRSKLNAQAGSLTPMSSIFLSVITLLCGLFLAPSLYYIPKPTLAALSCAVGISMLQECAHDICFFLNMHAWNELAQMFIVCGIIFSFSLSWGVVVGLGWTIFGIVRTSTMKRFPSGSREVCVMDIGVDRPLATQTTCTAITFEITEHLSFISNVNLMRSIRQKMTSAARYLILDIRYVVRVDACCLKDLYITIDHLKVDGKKVVLCLPANKQMLQRLHLGGLVELCSFTTTECPEEVMAGLETTVF